MASNRSENTYQKISTIFMRDANNIIMPYSGFVSPELEWLRNCKFDATEKIDGTNMRIEVTCNIINGERHMVVEYKGKSDNAQIPPHLYKFMVETFPKEKVLAALNLPEIITDTVLVERGWITILEFQSILFTARDMV